MTNGSMNYLAHIYLSGDNEMVKLGNFMADDIKGSSFKTYPDEIQKGILLHRRIDWFTDQNEIVRKSKRRLNDRYGLYRGIIIDILYDHMLAADWARYSSVDLQKYAENFYGLLEKNENILPDKIQHMSKYMIRHDWLTSYASVDGIEQVLEGMNRRTGGKGEMNLAIADLKDNYEGLAHDFLLFFEKLRTFSAENLSEINEQFTS